MGTHYRYIDKQQAQQLSAQTIERRRKPANNFVFILIKIFAAVFTVFSPAQLWFSRRHLFCDTFRGCFRGKMLVNDVAHEYLHAFLLCTCFRRCFCGSTYTHSFREVFALFLRLLLYTLKKFNQTETKQ